MIINLGDAPFKAFITVKYPSGTCTVSLGNKSFTHSGGGTHTFTVNKKGTWTVTATASTGLTRTTMYVGGGKEVEASINEFGTARGGRPGDQTGKEFYVRDYRNYPWNCVLRYTGEANNSLPLPDIFWPPRELSIGMIGGDVCALQGLLCARGYYLECDRDFGNLTRTATMAFQAESGLIGDGIAGPLTWDKLLARG